MSTPEQTASEIRGSLDHPVVDADGHIVEYWPELDRYMKAEGIDAGIAAFMQSANFDGSPPWQRMSPEDRERKRAFRSPWWGFPNDARDLASASAPALLHSRLDELGIDLAICYPSIGLNFSAQRDETLRRKAARAYNRYVHDQFEGLGDRLIPVAVIPTNDPNEAIDEIDFATEELGLRAVVLGSFAARRFEDGNENAFWIDGLGLDSIHDYDPLWQRLVDKGLLASFHSGSMGWSGRRSTTNFSYNHMGNFAGANEATAKSMFFGGVLNRFPELRTAFLEGGVTWAVQMLVGFVEHWHKRGPEGLKDLDPKGLDGELYDQLIAENAGPLSPVPGWGTMLGRITDTADVVNDFELAGIGSKEDICRQVTQQCCFGCEADDPLAGLAYDTKRIPGDDPMLPIFSSDIGHWDVAHMHEVLPEAYEHIEHGWMDRDQFRGFMCDNAVRMYGEANPHFFEGTVIEDYAAKRLGA
jgi:predicted TIM-barrel fold metal-dependent hydrolase